MHIKRISHDPDMLEVVSAGQARISAFHFYHRTSERRQQPFSYVLLLYCTFSFQQGVHALQRFRLRAHNRWAGSQLDRVSSYTESSHTHNPRVCMPCYSLIDRILIRITGIYLQLYRHFKFADNLCLLNMVNSLQDTRSNGQIAELAASLRAYKTLCEYECFVLRGASGVLRVSSAAD